MSAAIQPIAGTETFRLFAAPVCAAVLTPESRDALGGIIDAIVPAPGPGETVGRPDGGGKLSAGLHRLEALSPLMNLFMEQGRVALARDHVRHGPLCVISCFAEESCGGADSAFRLVSNAYLAGIYVARTPAGGCTLEFEDPRAQASVLAPARLSDDAPDAPLARIEGRAGVLAVFPGYLRHRVVSEPEDGPHLVLRMGLMFQAFAETMARPKWQGNIQ